METSANTLPSGFRVSRSGNELAISWGMGVWAKVSGIFLPAFWLSPLVTDDWSHLPLWTVVLYWLLLLLVIYVVIVMFANHTTLAATRTEWAISRGPVPTLTGRSNFRFKRRFDPSQFSELVVLKRPEEPDAAYVLYGRRRAGTLTRPLPGLKKEEASYLKRVLEDRLRAYDPQAGKLRTGEAGGGPHEGYVPRRQSQDGKAVASPSAGTRKPHRRCAR